MNYRSRPLSRKKIRELTNLIRKAIKIKDAEPFPVILFLEHGGLKVFDYDYDICDKSELQYNYAETQPNKGILKIREDVYKRAINNVPRDLFTIAHEIGHALLHNNDTIVLARSGEKAKAYEDPEWQANTFAAELMVPSTAISNMNIEDIVQKYNCSKQVAEIQLRVSNI